MKTIVSLISVLTTLAMSSAMAQTTYNGTGTANGGGSNGEGISSVVVNNTASTISFTINSSQPQSAFVQYYVLMQLVGQGGSGSTALFNSAGALNSWGPSLGISTGENAFIATFNTGATPEMYSGGSFVAGSSVNYSAGGTGSAFASFTVPLSSLGLSSGSSFYFDVVSSYPNAAGQSAYGALDSIGGFPAETDDSFHQFTPGQNAYDAATDASGTKFGTAASMYTITSAPEPTTCTLIGLGALALISRVRRNAS
jgi:hypothetical protein